MQEVRHVVCGMGLCQREGLAQLHSNQQVCLVQIFFITARETSISLLLKANELIDLDRHDKSKLIDLFKR